jgi:IS1 family transposase
MQACIKMDELDHSDHWDSFVTAFTCYKQVIGKFFTADIEGNNN